MASAVQACDTLAVATCMLVPFRKTKARQLAKKIIGDKTVEQATMETVGRMQRAEDELQEAVAVEGAHAETVKEARSKYDELGAEINLKIEEEISAALDLRELRVSKGALSSNTYTVRMQLFDAQRKLAMLEVMAVNREKIRYFAEEAQVAVRAAEEANRLVTEEKKIVKRNLEAARKAWGTIGNKRSSRTSACEVESPSSKRPKVDGKAIASPSLSLATLKCPSVSPTLVQSPCFSHAATMVDDAQPLASL